MNITLLVSDFVILGITNYFAHRIYNSRYSNKCLNFFIYIILSLLFYLTNFNGPTHLTTLTLFIIFLFLHLILYKIDMSNAFFTSILEILLISTSEFSSMLIMNIIFKLNGSTPFSSFLYILSLIISNCIFFLSCYMFMKLNKSLSHISNNKYIFYLAFIPTCSMLLFLYFPNYFNLVENNKPIFITFLFLAFYNLFSIYLISKHLESVKTQNELKKDKEHIEIEFKLYSKYYYENFNLLHALLHSYTDMKLLLDNKNYDELDQKLTDLSNKTLNEFNSIFSESLLLNTIISNKISILSQYNIVIKTKLLYSDFSFMNIVDATTFFSKIIDYCIDCCKEFDNSIIYINSKLINKKPALHFYFSSNKDINYIISTNTILSKIISNYKIHSLYTFDLEESLMHLIFIFY